MPQTFTKPTNEAIRKALQRYAPALAEQPIELLDEGWTSWAFAAGDYILRLPKLDKLYSAYGDVDPLGLMRLEQRLLRELAPTLPLPIPQPDLLIESGPNGLPFLGHRRIEGVPLRDLGRPPGPGFGASLGRFLKALHSFDVSRAVALGVTLIDGPTLRSSRIALFERVIRRVFPIISCEARTYTEQRFLVYLNDSANFQFEPRLIHHDLDRQNTLADPDTGELCGVIDFGDVVAGPPAIDFWMPLKDFARLGIAEQTDDFFAAYGEVDLEQVLPEVEFVDFLWPFHDMLYGLSIGDDEFVEGGIKALNDELPSSIRC